MDIYTIIKVLDDKYHDIRYAFAYYGDSQVPYKQILTGIAETMLKELSSVERDIQLVMEQSSVSHKVASECLLKNEGNIVNAIMNLCEPAEPEQTEQVQTEQVQAESEQVQTESEQVQAESEQAEPLQMRRYIRRSNLEHPIAYRRVSTTLSLSPLHSPSPPSPTLMDIIRSNSLIETIRPLRVEIPPETTIWHTERHTWPDTSESSASDADGMSESDTEYEEEPIDTSGSKDSWSTILRVPYCTLIPDEAKELLATIEKDRLEMKELWKRMNKNMKDSRQLLIHGRSRKWFTKYKK